MQMGPEEGSPQFVHSLNLFLGVRFFIAGLKRSIALKTVNFVPACRSSIWFSSNRMSFLIASEA